MSGDCIGYRVHVAVRAIQRQVRLARRSTKTEDEGEWRRRLNVAREQARDLMLELNEAAGKPDRKYWCDVDSPRRAHVTKSLGRQEVKLRCEEVRRRADAGDFVAVVQAVLELNEDLMKAIVAGTIMKPYEAPDLARLVLGASRYAASKRPAGSPRA